MVTPFFSIIIPVYNGLTHDLPICLNSIWGQSLDKNLYEVICVDDCSTDDTRQWLKEQRKEHNNLRIIENEKNIRQGGSRNKGVRDAKGKYIIFIDQDDYFHKESITAVYNHLQKEYLEILIVDCAYQSPGKVSNKIQHNFPHREVMTGDEMIERNSIPYAPWKFIFLRSHMIDNNLFFVEGERIEDVDWVHRLTHYAQKVQFQPILFIHYNKNDLSTTMNAYKSKEIIYSGLRKAIRMEHMLNSTFISSSEEIKHYIQNLNEKQFITDICYYFFFYDNIKRKSEILKQTSHIKIYTKSPLIKFARYCPKTFSFISNIISPFGQIAMYIYRHIKY